MTRDATHMAAKIVWLKRHPPDGEAAARYHQPVSYLVARPAGVRLFDHGLASTTMRYGLVRRGWEPELLDGFGIPAEELPEIAEAGATFLPALSGAMAPEWIASACGRFYGLTPAHGAGQLARAALEGCAFAKRDVAERLIAPGVTVEGLLLGGGARSRVWAQIRADCTGLPVWRPALTDTSPLGAAICATVAGGLHSDIPSCAARVGGDIETVAPDPASRAAYDDAYGAYALLFDSLRPMFERAAPGAAPGAAPRPPIRSNNS